MTTHVKAMNDLQAVTHALVDNKQEHRVVFGTHHHPHDALVYGSFVSARFEPNSSGSWSLVRALYDGRPVDLTGLLASIEEA